MVTGKAICQCTLISQVLQHDRIGLNFSVYASATLAAILVTPKRICLAAFDHFNSTIVPFSYNQVSLKITDSFVVHQQLVVPLGDALSDVDSGMIYSNHTPLSSFAQRIHAMKAVKG